MKTCANGHVNEDDSRFCESCGKLLPDAPDPVADDDLDTSADDVDEDDLDDIDVDDDSGDDDDDADDVDPDDDDDDADPDDDDVLDPLIVSADDDDDDANQPVVPAHVPPMTSVVDEMTVWARANGVEDDPYVSGLATAVRQRNDLGMWADIDPLDVLPEPQATESVLRRVIQVMVVLRNVGVFLPVALTWMAISKATTAYKGWDPSNGAVPGTGQSVQVEKNFLDFWSNGYGILDRKWTIPEIGKVDFYIIMVIIALALLISALSTIAEKSERTAQQTAEQERIAIAIKIRRGTHGKRQASPESIAESLADALNDLNQTTRDMAEVAGRLERASAGVEALTPRMEALNATAATFANRTSVEVTNAVNALVRSVESLNSSVSSNLTQVFEAAVANLQEAGEQLARTSASMEYGTKLLKDDIEAIRKGLRR